MEEEIKNPKLTPTQRPHYRARMINTAVKDIAATQKSLMKLFAVKEGMAMATAINMIERVYEVDMSPIKKLIPTATHVTGFLSPTVIGSQLGGMSPVKVNKLLERLHFQHQEIGGKGKTWRIDDAGRAYGEEKPYEASSGHSGYQIVWNENVISLLQDELRLNVGAVQ